MSEVQLFPQVGKSKWVQDELAESLAVASPHVRYLLKELSETKGEIAASDLKSKRVSYAIVQRICNSSNKDALVLTNTDPATGEKSYRLNPDYREMVTPIVRDATEPPPTPPRPRRPKNTGMGRGRRSAQMSAVDGIADPQGFGRIRQVTQTTGTRSIAFPSGISLEFCQELISFLNHTGSTRYRVVLDGAGPRLEAS